MNSLAEEFAEKDYEALTAKCGWGELAGWTTVAVSGGDRHSFLHNMCTNDIRGLAPGEGCETFLTDVKGKLVGHCAVLPVGESLLLLTVPGQAEHIIGHLDRYIIREDVQLSDESTQWRWLVLSGNDASAIASELFRVEISDEPAAWQTFPAGEDAGAPVVVQCPVLGGTTLLLGCSEESDAQVIERLVSHGVQCCDATAWQALRVESGFPLYGVDIAGENLPQEANRDTQAISFRKGCYLGQETVARIDALGHVNRLLVRLRFDPEAKVAEGCELTRDEKSVGKVTSLCWSPREGAPLALALIRRGANEGGTELQSEVGAAVVLGR